MRVLRRTSPRAFMPKAKYVGTPKDLPAKCILIGHMKDWPVRFLTEEEQVEVDMTKKSYWILRHALLCHSKVKRLLPKE